MSRNYEDVQNVPNIPMPRSGSYEQQQRHGKGNGHNNQQQGNKNNQQNQRNDKPNFNPPPITRQNRAGQVLYRQVAIYRPPWLPGITCFVPCDCLYSENGSVVDGTLTFRKSQIQGWALVEGNGQTVLYHRDDPEYSEIQQQIDIFEQFIRDADELLEGSGIKANKRINNNRRSAKGGKETVITKWIIPFWMKMAMIVAILLTLVFIFLLLARG